MRRHHQAMPCFPFLLASVPLSLGNHRYNASGGSPCPSPLRPNSWQCWPPLLSVGRVQCYGDTAMRRAVATSSDWCLLGTRISTTRQPAGPKSPLLFRQHSPTTPLSLLSSVTTCFQYFHSNILFHCLIMHFLSLLISTCLHLCQKIWVFDHFSRLMATRWSSCIYSL